MEDYKFSIRFTFIGIVYSLLALTSFICFWFSFSKTVYLVWTLGFIIGLTGSLKNTYLVAIPIELFEEEENE